MRVWYINFRTAIVVCHSINFEMAQRSIISIERKKGHSTNATGYQKSIAEYQQIKINTEKNLKNKNGLNME